MWVQPIICDKRNNGLFWIIFLKSAERQSEIVLITRVLDCLWTVEEMQETTVYCIQKRHTRGDLYSQREREGE
jgi:hypothetical protein